MIHMVKTKHFVKIIIREKRGIVNEKGKINPQKTDKYDIKEEEKREGKGDYHDYIKN